MIQNKLINKADRIDFELDQIKFKITQFSAKSISCLSFKFKLFFSLTFLNRVIPNLNHLKLF